MIFTPTKGTLKKYGLSEPEWRSMLDSQAGVCAVCEREPTKGRLCIDHEHVKGWKKLPPSERKLYVRGLLCWVCNAHYLFRGITISRSQNVTTYLQKYEARRPPQSGAVK
jgi:hypothetical protein